MAAPPPLGLFHAPPPPSTPIERLLATFGSGNACSWTWSPSALFSSDPWEPLYERAPNPLACGATSAVYEGWVRGAPQQRVAIKILRFERNATRLNAALAALTRGALRDAAAAEGGGCAGLGAADAAAAAAARVAAEHASSDSARWEALLNKGCHEVAALRAAQLVNAEVREEGSAPRLHELLSAHCVGLGGSSADMPRELVIVTKLCNKGDLIAALWRENVRVMDAAAVLREAFLGVADLHARGIVHNDLKPGNILVHRDEAGAFRAVVADLGSVKLPGLRLSGTEGPFDTFGGTEEYLAPEVDADSSGGQPRDVFALGVLLAQMLCGGAPSVELQIAQDPRYGPVDKRHLQHHPPTYSPPPHAAWTNEQADEALGVGVVGQLWDRHAEGPLRGLLRGMLEADPRARLPLREALAHDWWQWAAEDGRPLAVEPSTQAHMSDGDGGGSAGSGSAPGSPISFAAGSQLAAQLTQQAQAVAEAQQREQAQPPPEARADAAPLTPASAATATVAAAAAAVVAAAAAAPLPPRPLLHLYGRACRSRSSSEEVALVARAFQWRHNLYRLRLTLDAVADASQSGGSSSGGSGSEQQLQSLTCNDEGAPVRLSQKTGSYFCGRQGTSREFFWNGCESCAGDNKSCGKQVKGGLIGCECHSCHRLNVLATAAAGDAGNVRRSVFWPCAFRLCAPMVSPSRRNSGGGGSSSHGIQLPSSRAKRPRSPEKNALGRRVVEADGHFWCGAEVGPAGLWVGWQYGWAHGTQVFCKPTTGANCAACHVLDVSNLRGAVGANLLPALPQSRAGGGGGGGSGTSSPCASPISTGSFVKTAPPGTYGDGMLGQVVALGQRGVQVRLLRQSCSDGTACAATAAAATAAAPAPSSFSPRGWGGITVDEDVRGAEEQSLIWVDPGSLMRADLMPPPLVLVGPRRGDAGGVGTAGEQLDDTLATRVRAEFHARVRAAGARGLSREHLGGLLQAVGLRGARYDPEALFDLLDHEESGQIDLRELLLGLAHLVSFRATELTLLSLLFYAFDADGDGVLSKGELGELLAAFGAPPAAVEAVERARRHGLDPHQQTQKGSLAGYAVALFDKMDSNNDNKGEGRVVFYPLAPRMRLTSTPPHPNAPHKTSS